jgi:hypothetical protein
MGAGVEVKHPLECTAHLPKDRLSFKSFEGTEEITLERFHSETTHLNSAVVDGAEDFVDGHA